MEPLLEPLAIRTSALPARPRPAWTGVQYSIYRVLLASLLAWRLLDVFPLLPAAEPLGPATRLLALFLGLLACLLLAVGWRDRWAAVGLLGLLLLFAFLPEQGVPLAEWMLLVFLVLLHLITPPRPFGSWDARSRLDPAGGWRLPAMVWHMAWLALAAIQGLAASGVAPVDLHPSLPTASALPTGWLGLVGRGLALLVLAAAIHPPLRRVAWGSILLWQIAWTSAAGGPAAAFVPSFWALHLLAFDPGWIPPRASPRSALAGSSGRRAAADDDDDDDVSAPSSTSQRPARLFYDGGCGFCHGSVRFILAEEMATPADRRLHFAPLESPDFDALLERHPSLQEDLPDSIVIELEDGTLLMRSGAVLELARRLGGVWRALAMIGGVLPRSWLDRAYDAVARVRQGLLARPEESCPILPPHLRSRFHA